MIVEWQQPLRRPGQVMAKCVRHFVADVQGIKLMGLARPQSVASVRLSDSTYWAATTVTLNFRLLSQMPGLSRNDTHSQYPKCSGDGVAQSERSLNRSRPQILTMLCLKTKIKYELLSHAQLAFVEGFGADRAYRWVVIWHMFQIGTLDLWNDRYKYI